MKREARKVIFILIVLVINSDVFSQNNRIGGSFLYNLHTNSFGLGVRAEFPLQNIKLLEGLSLVPQLAYYPSFNPVTEFYIGMGLQMRVYKINNWLFYALTNFSYNGWINYDDTEYREGEFSNIGIELGIGASVKVKKCWYPFFEFRYNARWSEITMQLGILYTLKCERRGAVPCSKIPPQPQF